MKVCQSKRLIKASKINSSVEKHETNLKKSVFSDNVVSKYFGDPDANGTEHYKSDRTKIKQFPSPLTHSTFLTIEAHSIPPRSTPSVIKFYYSFLSLYPFLFRFFKLHSSKTYIFPASPGTSPLLRYLFL